MVKCPICGTENDDEVVFCKKCGSRISVVIPSKSEGQPVPPAPSRTPIQTVDPENEAKTTVAKRLDALKNKDENMLKAIMDENYTKFDDWSPYRRQEREEAINNELSAYKVLSGYTYELRDFKANMIGDVAVATFTIHYQAIMNKEQYDITSRATTILIKKDTTWKVLHEHYSRFPEKQTTTQSQGGQRRSRFPF
ncbi:MAG TPA: nuclear transport factor 2 family protein [Candidatus Nanoarchaeia archaeon]|nr:nuclear transport factor 2 family protein [Candidatus Nanoarchaeia archaeon]